MTNPKLAAAALAATPEELAEALRRLRAVQGGNPAVAGVTLRTLDRWKRDYRDAENLHGCGFLGLLPKVRLRGNRTDRFPPEVYSLAANVIADDFLTFKQKGRLPVYVRFRDECVAAGHGRPSYQWFCERIRQLDRYEATKARKGKRAAYPFEPRSESTGSQRTCDRPFERVHIDHTLLDLQLISSTTGKPIGRPWLSLMAVCRKAGCHQSFAARKFPDLAQRIIVHRRTYVQIHKHHRLLFTGLITKSVGSHLAAAGQYPSHRKMSRALPSWISLRDPVAKKAWQELLEEWGWKGGRNESVG